jgi:hypothetical protein
MEKFLYPEGIVQGSPGSWVFVIPKSSFFAKINCIRLKSHKKFFSTGVLYRVCNGA